MKKQNLRYMKWIGKMIILLFIFNFQFSIFNYYEVYRIWIR